MMVQKRDTNVAATTTTNNNNRQTIRTSRRGIEEIAPKMNQNTGTTMDNVISDRQLPPQNKFPPSTPLCKGGSTNNLFSNKQRGYIDSLFNKIDTGQT